jgi:hypothetical protein
VWIASGLLALVIVAPLLAPGFTLAYDMVFVPHPHFTRELLGLTPVYPRTVPTQALVAVFSAPLGGQLVEKSVLVGIFALAALGAARLTPASHPVARIAAGVLYAWNPMTYERLLLGQWSLLLGYAVLPWAVRAALTWRSGRQGSTPRLVLWLTGLTAASPYFGFIGGGITLAVVMWPPADAQRVPRSRWAWLVPAGGLIAVSLMWLVPALLHPSAPDSPRLAVDLFRARSDSPLGTVGSLLSLGGLWRADLGPPGRNTIAWIPAFLLVGGLAIVGWKRLRDAWPTGARRALLTVAVVGLLLAAAPSLPVLGGVMRWVAATLPSAGFLRDSQKFVTPWALALAVAFGMGVDRVQDSLPARDRLARLGVLALPLLPVALAPTLVWGAGGRLHTAAYPTTWSRVETLTASDPRPGAILTLPWHAYLPFAWNEDATVHQPAPLFFSRPVIAATALEVNGHVLPAEDPRSRLLDPIVLDPRPFGHRLSRLGVRYVLLFHEADYREDGRKVAGLHQIFKAPDLTLYLAGRARAGPTFRVPPLGPVLAGDAVAVVAVAIAAGGAISGRLRRRQPGGPSPGGDGRVPGQAGDADHGREGSTRMEIAGSMSNGSADSPIEGAAMLHGTESDSGETTG